MKRQPFQLSLSVSATVLIALIAIMAIINLLYMRRLYEARVVQLPAEVAVVSHGRALVHELARRDVVRSAEVSPEAWKEFGRYVDTLYEVDDSLQFVSLMQENEVLFERQRNTLIERPRVETLPPVSPVKHGKGMIALSGTNLPVVMFTAQVSDENGGWRSVQIGVRKGYVDERQQTAREALRAMFRVAALTTVLSFSLATGLLVWMVRRDVRRQRKSADEEHLTFAGVMADGIVHDLRNPMSSMKLDVQMLDRELQKGEEARAERIRDVAARVSKTLDRMDAVFGEFLYLSQPGGAEPQAADLCALVTDCVDLLKPHFEREEVVLHFEPTTQAFPVRLRPVETKRALVNILTNARQVSGSGSRVDVQLSAQGGRAVLEVMDEGPGLPAKDPDRIFKMFETGRPGGTGIGLALARMAIEGNDGRIEAASRSPKGAVFTISFLMEDVE